MKNSYWSLLFFVMYFMTGCSAIGPDTVERDRLDYNKAISNSWKEQTLLNIIKIRYADMPLFLEVASIVSGYSLEGSVNLGGTVSSENAIQGDFLAMGTNGKFTDRPTITYSPITGQKFNKSFMTPIPPHAVMFLMQSGWPADIVLQLTLDSINGLRSRNYAGVNQRSGDSDFYRIISLFRKIQKSGSIGMRIIKNEDMKDTIVMFFHKQNIPPEIKEAIHESFKLLGLNPDSQEIKVNYGHIASSDTEIVMITHSLLQIMIRLATQVDVPQIHIDEGRTMPLSQQETWEREDLGRLITINHGREQPEDAFTAVKYRGYWFWIDDRDFFSKRTFAFLMLLFSLPDTGGSEGLPLVTIPAG